MGKVGGSKVCRGILLNYINKILQEYFLHAINFYNLLISEYTNLFETKKNKEKIPL